MAHRSLPPLEPDVDPFWHDAARHRSRWRDWMAPAMEALRSWAVVGVGLLLLAGLGWWFLRPGSAPVESALPLAETSAPAAGTTGAGGTGAGPAGAAPGDAAPGASTTSSLPGEVVVQAAGAVVHPGVYSLPAQARVDDLVDAAGGLTKTADRDRVNLAAPLTDGERVWLPARGEDKVPEIVAGAGGGGGSAAGASTGSSGGTGTSRSGGGPSPGAPVDLNTATADELDALPGVGPATASAILAYRDQNGRFSSVDELLDVRGIGDAKLEQLRPLVRV